MRLTFALVAQALLPAAATLLSPPASLLGQTNPVPFVSLPLAPTTVAPGSPAFKLTVHGSQFEPSSVVTWNGSPRTTKFVSATELSAKILGSDVALPTSAALSVTTPAPGGGRSNTTLVEVAIPRTAVSFNLLCLCGAVFPYFIAVADVNRDGNLDLIYSSTAASTVTILLGSGDGTFAQGKHYPVGSTPQSLAVADINGDGYPDIVVADLNSSEISVLLGKGDGTFQPAVNYAASAAPASVVLGDFNRDGKLDAVVAYSNENSLGIFFGNGDGTFQPPVSFGTGSGGMSVAIGDFNGDGILDLAVAQYSAVNVLLGNGDGTFQTAIPISLGGGVQSIAIADFNGDGKPDLVVAPQGTTNMAVAILLGNGNGSFGPPMLYSTAPGPDAVAVGDMNGDGIIDVITANNSTTQASILLGNGDGTFQSPMNYDNFGGYPAAVAVADFNHDGLPDLAFAAGAVVVLLQTTVVLSPPSFTFPDQMVGKSSAPLTVTLTNTASVPLAISGIALGGANPGDYSQTNTCGSTVAPAATCTVTVTFTPQAPGSASATLTFNDNAPNNPQTVPLYGTGLEALVNFSPPHLIFPDQVIFTKSTQTVTLTNTGNETLSLTGIAATGAFSQTNTCGASVTPGTNCTITVTFRPLAKGPSKGTLSLTDNAPGSPQTVPLSGTGTYVDLQPTSLSLGTQPVGTTSLPRKVTLSNKGSVPLSITGITITGADPADFAQTSACGSSVAAGGNCAITVTFTPAAKGKRTADIAISDNGGGSPQLVPLTGTGT